VPTPPASSGDVFPPTRWSLVRTSAQPEALEELCRAYWRPIYSFLRRSGYSAPDAEDLTQSFFSDLIRNEGLSRANEHAGKLRSFLLGSLKRHLSAAKRHESRQKRGANAEHLPFAQSEMDFSNAEHQYASLPADELTPDILFERRWVLDILHRAQERLLNDYEKSGKRKEYELLKGAAMNSEAIDHLEISRTLGVKEATVRVLVHRMRKNLRAAFKEQIAQTVADRSEIDEEYHRLLQIFS